MRRSIYCLKQPATELYPKWHKCCTCLQIFMLSDLWQHWWHFALWWLCIWAETLGTIRSTSEECRDWGCFCDTCILEPRSYHISLVKSHTVFSILQLFGETSHNILQSPSIWCLLTQYSPASYYLVKPHTIVSSLLLFSDFSQNIL
jgi:hypothetical protein